MTVAEAAAALSLEALALPCGEKEIRGGYAGDLLSWVMGRAEAGSAWVTIMTNSNIVAVASLLELSCIILAESSACDDALRNLAAEKGVNLLRSPQTAYALCNALGRIL